ncbi:CHAT domain-containing protein [Oscillatoriales cyanobacterium LEGE 11467]|uniref:CHAT domain-containing protein n=1 Tax=Zarconia navalis LEGE 11467 TaxID=1828826 RepID=A0A928Z9J5_9CYAN|nr:CHAT domain-containing protein [Zarconia navalis]MBE9042730.1 CHAT domain-containing protein [Zarconia navalis LEGE 11467]
MRVKQVIRQQKVLGLGLSLLGIVGAIGLSLPSVAGTVTFGDGTQCEGDFQDSQLNGFGQCIYSNGNKYEGEFRDGEANGRGIFTFANGDVYEGEFRDGQRNGVGLFTFANGDRYEGEFRDNRRNGRGILFFSNGDIYEGEFREDKRNGLGTFTFANGDVYEGEFRDNKKHGQGVFTFANGDRMEGVWIEDRLSNEAFENVEKDRNAEFSAYLGGQIDLVDRRLSQGNAQAVFREIESQTGKKIGILYVVVHPQRLELVLMSSSGTSVVRQLPDVDREEVLEVAREFRREITGGSFPINNTRYLPSAQQLYQWTIAPLETDLENNEIDTLLFSMDAGLRSLPIAALHDGEQFLVEKYDISLIPSFNLSNIEYEPLDGARILAMGASEFDEHRPLPAVPVELETISSVWSGESFLNEEFTLANLTSQREAEPFRVIHLATHAEFKPGTLDNSYIQLWDDRLTLEELQTLNWNDPPVELLVLSACRTALDDRQAELGLAGLAVQSGAKTVLASLWYVSDRGTLALMSEFYSFLLESPTKAEALRQAQIAMLEGEVRLSDDRTVGPSGEISLPPDSTGPMNIALSHPYYWAGFTMIGSPF